MEQFFLLRISWELEQFFLENIMEIGEYQPFSPVSSNGYHLSKFWSRSRSNLKIRVFLLKTQTKRGGHIFFFPTPRLHLLPHSTTPSSSILICIFVFRISYINRGKKIKADNPLLLECVPRPTFAAISPVISNGAPPPSSHAVGSRTTRDHAVRGRDRKLWQIL